MIDLYYAPTPNGWKVSIMLEECGLPYTAHFLDIFHGAQFTPQFLAINPNAKMPAIVDHDVAGDPVPVFESGAILWYLADKTGRFMPSDPLGRKEAMEWLFWQTGNQGPMAGQLSHFRMYGPKDGQDYALTRYRGEYERTLAVLEWRLRDRDFILGEYSVADMLSFPWAFIAKNLDVSLDPFPQVQRWRETIKNRPAVRKAIDLMKDRQNKGEHNAGNNPTLYNQDARHLLDI
ncbi:glutathione S-transferase family protein [Pararhizobium haloflavum]|uniref:glutathione S-transferase family protein n=1 Tax=Pararhizobium haloflavum TaxID=2037914 RepID=UPI000C17974B|nr:glutathione S-transferase N-terminal domain-containing protein [Pararhizobium haloflavum]